MKRILFAALLTAVGFSGAYAGTQYYTEGGRPGVYCTTGEISCSEVGQLYNEAGQPVEAPANEFVGQPN